MVTGETGAGKSTLLNALVGHPVLETGRSKKQAVKRHVIECKCMKGDVEIVAIDCPGLHDRTINEDTYLQEMHDKINAHRGIDLLLYCKKMTDTCTRGAEIDAHIITKLTRKLGKRIWQHSLFVLTFANVYEKVLKQRNYKQADIVDQFKQTKREWKIHIGDTLKRCGINHDECHIEVCTTGFKQPQLCGKPYWLSDFWASAYKVQDENGALALLRLNTSRIVDKAPKESFYQTTRNPKKAQDLVTGMTTGTTVGATIGAVFKRIKAAISFGPAAGAGVKTNGEAGASVGSLTRDTMLELDHKRKDQKKEATAAAKTLQATESDSFIYKNTLL
jgi:predicted ATPase